MRIITLLVITILAQASLAQQPKWTSAELHHQLQKLNFLGTALYVAAHPDDENQRIISYLGNHTKARTGYLSLTRGDGGQNLIGPELREQLGVLRTQELLAARAIDGGEQLFSRAVDFGYSKHPDETLAIWNKDSVLADMVWAIRKFKPDIIINRFDHRSPGRTHGHHTASAMLAFDAFDMTNNANAFPEQLDHTDTWQPKRLFFNTSWWFYGSRENFEKADKSNLYAVDIGVYYPALGLSNNEIAAMARSQHKCQGFGQLTSRGSTIEYLEFLKGDPINGTTDVFEGINTTWSRVEGGTEIKALLEPIEANFNFSDPSVHVPDLVKAYALLQNITDSHWRELKSGHLKQIILAAAGVYLEANAETATATPGETINITIEAINRSSIPIMLNQIAINSGLASINPTKKLVGNTKENLKISVPLSPSMAYTAPFWLAEKGNLGMYQVNEQTQIAQAETKPALMAKFHMTIANTAIDFDIPIVRRYSKPDMGELVQPFFVLPEATVGFEDDVFIFSGESPKTIPLTIRAGKDNISGTLQVAAPEGWTVAPLKIPFSIEKKDALKTVTVTVSPPNGESQGQLAAQLTLNGKTIGQQLMEIDYGHIPKQYVLQPSEARVVRLDIQKNGTSIGYVVGAGDKVPESLRQIGYEVDIIDVETVQADDLVKYDGIVMGIRAYNVVDALKFKQPVFLDYVKNGGNLIVQYNTARRWATQFENIAPYPITISRDRVTDEHSNVAIIAPKHPVVQTPNKIGTSDFDGWVQERGLYFPNEWDERFTPILAMNDNGEPVKKGSLLVAQYGKGHYIYTGLSFFRELPVGVPGAYKLFANMLSLGNNNYKNGNNAGGKR